MFSGMPKWRTMFYTLFIHCKLCIVIDSSLCITFVLLLIPFFFFFSPSYVHLYIYRIIPKALMPHEVFVLLLLYWYLFCSFSFYILWICSSGVNLFLLDISLFSGFRFLWFDNQTYSLCEEKKIWIWAKEIYYIVY